MSNIKDKIDISLVKACAPMGIILLILCLLPRHLELPSWIKWSIGIFGVLSLLNCFVTLAGMKKKANVPAPDPTEEKNPGPDM